MVAVLVPPMTAEEARACVARFNAYIAGARAELLRLYEAAGWCVLGYDSWRACVVAEVAQGQAALYRERERADGGHGVRPRRGKGTDGRRDRASAAAAVRRVAGWLAGGGRRPALHRAARGAVRP